MSSKCPKCETMFTRLKLTTMEASGGPRAPSYKTVVLSCPYCSTAIGAQIDPIAIKTDIIEGLMNRLRG